MCGIFLNFSKSTNLDLNKNLSSLNLLDHRGPDDKHYLHYKKNYGSIFIGHTRLSIIDQSSNGRQPMTTLDERYILVFNGEIYNYKELKKELIKLGYVFKTESDTEVLLMAWVHYGKKCLKKLIGMFAFIIFDQKEKKISFARDAFGIKPLYFYIGKNSFLCSSEIKPIISQKKVLKSLNYKKCYEYLIHGSYEDDDLTFFEKIHHVKPSEILELNLQNFKLNNEIWWQPKFETNLKISFQDAAAEIKHKITSSIKYHLRSDVPVGFALSGGIDSSILVSATKSLDPNLELNNFTYSSGDSYDEVKWSQMMNSYVNGNLNEVKVNQNEIVDDLNKLVTLQGEPFGDTSIYAQFKVFEKVREKGIKVLLNGQGADELFAGYIGYPGYRMQSLIESKDYLKLVRFLKNWSSFPNRNLKLAFMEYGKIILNDQFYAFARNIKGRNFQPDWLDKNNSLSDLNFHENRPILSDQFKSKRVIEHLYNSITKRGLRSLLRHEDRNAMHFSIENRVPYLTTDLFEFVFTLPENFLISDMGVTKNILKSAFSNNLPIEILNRKDKLGFNTPQEQWIDKNYFLFKDLILEWAKNCSFINFKEFNIFIKNKNTLFKDRNLFWRLINFALWSGYVKEI